MVLSFLLSFFFVSGYCFAFVLFMMVICDEGSFRDRDAGATKGKEEQVMSFFFFSGSTPAAVHYTTRTREIRAPRGFPPPPPPLTGHQTRQQGEGQYYSAKLARLEILAGNDLVPVWPATDTDAGRTETAVYTARKRRKRKKRNVFIFFLFILIIPIIIVACAKKKKNIWSQKRRNQLPGIVARVQRLADNKAAVA